jgi:hypothetical protein
MGSLLDLGNPLKLMQLFTCDLFVFIISLCVCV